MDYKKYCSDCKAKGHEPTMSEKQFNEMMGISEDATPVFVARKNASHKQVKPTFPNHIKQEKERK